jgi:cation transport ATPase
LLGKSPLSSSPYLISLAALATIIGGYPVLQSGFHKIAEKKKLNAELLLFSLTLILLTMRESIAGLSVLWLVYMTNLSGQTLQQQTKQHLNRLLPCKTAFPVPAAAQSRPLTGRSSPIHYKARLLLAVSIAGIVYLTTRDAMRSLAVLVAGCPVTAALSRSSALEAAMLAAAKQRIFIKEAQAIEFAEQLSPQSFAVPSPLADELVIALGQDSVKKAGYAAHVVICDNDPRKLDELIRLGRQTNEIIRQNAILTTWFNGTGMLLAALRLLSPVGAGLLLNACTVTVILNSRRLSPTNCTLELKSRAANHSIK